MGEGEGGTEAVAEEGVEVGVAVVAAVVEGIHLPAAAVVDSFVAHEVEEEEGEGRGPAGCTSRLLNLLRTPLPLPRRPQSTPTTASAPAVVAAVAVLLRTTNEAVTTTATVEVACTQGVAAGGPPPPLIDPLNRTNLTSPTSLINSDPSPLRYYNPLTITPF